MFVFLVFFYCLTPFKTYSQISIATSPVLSCNISNGTATITVSNAAPGFDFEYAVDGVYQNANYFDSLSVGGHVATVRDKITKCEFFKNFTIDEVNPLVVNISGTGTYEFCNNRNPPTVTLSALAYGGSGDYDYTWPGRTLSVTANGSYQVTVTDRQTGCRKSEGGEVILVPILCSQDPNDIIGPIGYGTRKREW